MVFVRQTCADVRKGVNGAYFVHKNAGSEVLSGLDDVIAIAANGSNSVALRREGTIVVVGSNKFGQTNVPPSLTNAISIAVGASDIMALKSDQTVLVWGDNSVGQTNVPSGLTNVVAIAAGALHCLALRSDGTVVAWGVNGHPQTAVPAGLSNVTAIACGPLTSLALKNDGSLVAWGDERLPPGVSNLVGLAAGGNSFTGSAAFTMAIRRDGTVMAWDDDSYGQTNVPVGLSNVVMLAAGGTHCVAITQQRPQVNGVWFGAQGATLQFRGFSGQSYTVQSTADLGSNNWSDLPNGTVAGTGLDLDVIDTNSTALPHRFYRLQASPQ